MRVSHVPSIRNVVQKFWCSFSVFIIDKVLWRCHLSRKWPSIRKFLEYDINKLHEIYYSIWFFSSYLSKFSLLPLFFIYYSLHHIFVYLRHLQGIETSMFLILCPVFVRYIFPHCCDSCCINLCCTDSCCILQPRNESWCTLYVACNTTCCCRLSAYGNKCCS